MDDRFLHQGRREPPPEFAAALRERLRAMERADAPEARGRARRLVPALAWAAGLALVSALFLLPSVRASAQAFLDLFRVRNVAAVRVDAARIEELRAKKIDPLEILGRPEMLREPGPVKRFADAASASASAGYALLRPAGMPAGFALDSAFVQGETEARLTVDESRLRSLLETLDMHDVTLPPGLDGATVTAHVPPVVRLRYRRGDREASLVQAPSPEVRLPRGLDVAELGEIGLRIVGVDPAEARRIARSVDWHTTLLVPVPTDVREFREVEVNGHHGLMITSQRDPDSAKRHRGPVRVLLWSDGERVFAAGGDLSAADLVAMATSVR